ncbi:hypothetical protein I546_2178 [Mycobacterium kansasii 732]|nr:hypothetical protein I546_2178 [Mycobacterium kansasii 732]
MTISHEADRIPFQRREFTANMLSNTEHEDGRELADRYPAWRNPLRPKMSPVRYATIVQIKQP